MCVGVCVVTPHTLQASFKIVYGYTFYVFLYGETVLIGLCGPRLHAYACVPDIVR